MNKAEQIFWRLDGWQSDALDIGPEEIAADLAEARVDGTDGLIDRLEKERRGMCDGDSLNEALSAYQRLLDAAVAAEAVTVTHAEEG